jgi:hypothetical protein
MHVDLGNPEVGLGFRPTSQANITSSVVTGTPSPQVALGWMV